MGEMKSKARRHVLSATMAAVVLSMTAIAAQAGSAKFFNDAIVGETLNSLKNKLAELNETSKAIQAKADAEKRDLNPDEVKELEAVMAEFDEVEASIKRRQRIEDQASRLAAPQPRQTAPNPVANTAPANTPAPPARTSRDGLQNTTLSTQEQRQRWGFRDMGEFAISVRAAIMNPGAMDQRLVQNALTTYGSEGVNADGGFAVPPEWRAEIMRLVDAEGALLGQTDQQTVSGNTITFPIDETTAWQTTGGIQTYWDGEAAAIAQSKPQLKDLTLKLHRLTALVPVTEELLEDAPAMSGYVTSKAGEKLAFKVNDAILNGTGAGMPLGVMNAPCKVTVLKETSQTTGTFHADNAVKMMARMPAQSFGRSVWLVNQDVVPFILRMGFAVTTASGTAVGAGALYLPPNGLAGNSPYGTLLGRPIIVSEACQTVGTEGDVILADLSKYLSAVKGAVKSDVSIHLWFDQNTTAFRFVLRMNGQPWLSSPINRKNGSNTLSHFITCQTR